MFLYITFVREIRRQKHHGRAGSGHFRNGFRKKNWFYSLSMIPMNACRRSIHSKYCIFARKYLEGPNRTDTLIMIQLICKNHCCCCFQKINNLSVLFDDLHRQKFWAQLTSSSLAYKILSFKNYAVTFIFIKHFAYVSIKLLLKSYFLSLVYGNLDPQYFCIVEQKYFRSINSWPPWCKIQIHDVSAQ